jgi:hypothetical protein
MNAPVPGVSLADFCIAYSTSSRSARPDMRHFSEAHPSFVSHRPMLPRCDRGNAAEGG